MLHRFLQMPARRTIVLILRPRTIRTAGRTVILLVSLITLVTAEASAQSPEPDLTVSELQKQLVEMRSLMAAMQARVATLEAALLQSQTRSSQAVREQPDEPKTARDQTGLSFKGLT